MLYQVRYDKNSILLVAVYLSSSCMSSGEVVSVMIFCYTMYITWTIYRQAQIDDKCLYLGRECRRLG